jgi:ABC-type multidrug transport system fused ATPase/permease subunit
MRAIISWQGAAVVVLHDPSFLKHFDRIILMERGRIVEDGPWSVVQQSSAYRLWLHDVTQETTPAEAAEA